MDEEDNLRGGRGQISSEDVRGRRRGGSHPHAVVRHLSAADDSVDCDEPYRLGDLAEGRRSRFVPSITDLSCLP